LDVFLLLASCNEFTGEPVKAALNGYVVKIAAGDAYTANNYNEDM
jgi:hypothetical protein